MQHKLFWSIAALGLIAFGQPASAQKLISPADSNSPQQTGATKTLQDIRPSGAPIVLGTNGGTLIHLPGNARTVFVANPDIADVQVQSPSRIYIAAKKPGVTVFYAADDSGEILMNKAVQVQYEPTTIIRGSSAVPGGQPAPGPIVLQIPLQPAPAQPAQ